MKKYKVGQILWQTPHYDAYEAEDMLNKKVEVDIMHLGLEYYKKEKVKDIFELVSLLSCLKHEALQGLLSCSLFDDIEIVNQEGEVVEKTRKRRRKKKRRNDLKIILVKEYNGKDLLVDCSPSISFEDKISIVKKIAHLASFLHSKNILCFSLSIDNFLFSSASGVFMKDVGRVFSGLKEVLKIKEIERHYPPEVLLDDAFDKKSDVYMFGILVYELFSNKTVLDGLTDMERMERILSSDVVSEIEEEEGERNISDLIMKCVKKEKEERPSFDEILSFF